MGVRKSYKTNLNIMAEDKQGKWIDEHTRAFLDLKDRLPSQALTI